MSMDMPFYKELRRRNHPAARTWFLGDCLYYIGILMAMLAIAAGCVSIVGALVGWFGWSLALYAFGLLVLGVCVFFTGASLKQRSYRRAAQDDIRVEEY